jgi:hypothetical protein
VFVEAYAGWATYPTSDTGNPGEPRQKEARCLGIYENDQLDEAQMAIWVKQAAALAGWLP